MNLRFVSWNLNGFVRGGQAELLRSTPWDVCAVQEVTTLDAFTALADAVGAAGECARPHLADTNDATYVSGLLARPPWHIEASAVLDVPSPERALRAVAHGGDRRIEVASLALPPASSPRWGEEAKVRQALAIADWLARRERPTVVGIDANTPRWDRLDLAATEFWNAGEERLLGPRPDHDLRDVFREVVERDPDRRATIAAERPDGPLAVSHVRGHGERATPCRYDFVLASPDVAVVDADYQWEEARAAKSDHALVWAELNVP